MFTNDKKKLMQKYGQKGLRIHYQAYRGRTTEDPELLVIPEVEGR